MPYDYTVPETTNVPGFSVCYKCGKMVQAGMMCTCQTWINFTPVTNRQGWQCPKCGNCYAPHVSGCEKCNN